MTGVAPDSEARSGAHRARTRLMDWLINDACPLWALHGVDRVHGGFHERLSGTEGLNEPRRARVQPRQVWSFARASALGWNGDAAALVAHGFDYTFAHFRRSDGLFRTLVAPDGTSIDDRALLYDQAFVLLGLAESQKVPGGWKHAADEARLLRTSIYRHLGRAGGGFESELARDTPLSANAHMHLFEAVIAWLETSDEPEWRTLANEIGELALTRFIDASTGILREHFTSTWQPVPGLTGRMLEPGHHFEWAWLLLRWPGLSAPEGRSTAFRLIDTAEQHGVRNGVTVNSMLDDLSIYDAGARLWPQTERLKAAALAARLTGEDRYFTMVTSAADTLYRYLEAKPAGSWHDRMTPQGELIEEPAPASSFYHLVAAISELAGLRC